MEFLTSLTPQLIIILVFIATIAGVQLYSDAQEIKAARRLRRLTTEYAMQHNTPRISIIIDLRRTAETILPLLDHLYSHAYPHLEIIVLIKYTAGKYAQPKLSYYRRKHHLQQLKLIKHTKGMTTESIIRRNASGKAILHMSAGDTLSNTFFSTVATELLDEHVDVITPRRHIVTDSTLLSALCVVMSVWRYIFARLQKQPATSTYIAGSVYRREALLSLYSSRTSLKTTYAYQTAIHTAAKTIPRIKQRSIIGIVLLATAACLIVFLGNDHVILAIKMLFVGYCVIYTLFQLGIKEYSIVDRISLILFAPFSSIFFLTILFDTTINTVHAHVRSLQIVFKRRYLLTK